MWILWALCPQFSDEKNKTKKSQSQPLGLLVSNYTLFLPKSPGQNKNAGQAKFEKYKSANRLSAAAQGMIQLQN